MCEIMMDYGNGSQIFLLLESPSEHLQIPVPRLCPRPLKLDSYRRGPGTAFSKDAQMITMYSQV